MAGEHERGKREGQFCSVPADPKCADCPGSKTYIEVCKPDWNAHTFQRLVRNKIKPFTFAKKYEAHHIACVAPVTSIVAVDPDINDIVHQTKWCINKESNMLAMPLWGHTVKWYCVITAASQEADFDDSAKAPPFKDIPQHDFDHNCSEGYTWEVEQAAKRVVEKCKKANQEHKLKSGALAALLDKMSADFKTQLQTRGTRKGGTHAGWGLGQKEPPDAQWSHPFSMASDGKVSKIGFPVRNFSASVAKWVARIAKAMKGP